MFTIKHEVLFFQLKRREALQLELTLNKSAYGKQWSHIGDALYAFYIGTGGGGDGGDGGDGEMEVSKEQYDYLLGARSLVEY